MNRREEIMEKVDGRRYIMEKTYPMDNETRISCRLALDLDLMAASALRSLGTLFLFSRRGVHVVCRLFAMRRRQRQRQRRASRFPTFITSPKLSDVPPPSSHEAIMIHDQSAARRGGCECELRCELRLRVARMRGALNMLKK